MRLTRSSETGDGGRVVSGEWRVGKRLQNGRTASEPGARATGSVVPHLTRYLAPVLRALALAALTVPCSLFPVSLRAQMPTYKLGRPLTAEELRRWDTGVGPEGKELPPGSGTAKEGKELWMRRCAKCHGADARSSMPGSIRPPTPDNNPVLGGEKGLIQATQYATTIWDYIRRAMPLGEEAGSLNDHEVYAATAYLLYLERIIKEDDVMDAQTLPKVRMPHASGELSPYKRRF